MKRVRFEGKIWNVLEEGPRSKYEVTPAHLLGNGKIIENNGEKVYVLDWDVEEVEWDLCDGGLEHEFEGDSRVCCYCNKTIIRKVQDEE